MIGRCDGIVETKRNGLKWKHSPRDNGLPNTRCHHWKRWSRRGVYATIMTELAAQPQRAVMVKSEATHLGVAPDGL